MLIKSTAVRTINIIFSGCLVGTLSAMQAPTGQSMTLAHAVEKTAQFLDKTNCCDGPIEACVRCINAEQSQQRIRKYVEPCENEKGALCCGCVVCCASCFECPEATACCCGGAACCLYVLYKALKKDRWNRIRQGDKNGKYE